MPIFKDFVVNKIKGNKMIDNIKYLINKHPILLMFMALILAISLFAGIGLFVFMIKMIKPIAILCLILCVIALIYYWVKE